MSLKHTSITKGTFTTLLSRYASLVPSALTELDTLRYEEIPNILSKREEEDDDSYLTRDEVERLVEWKLKHGTFRPKLLQLVKSNPKELVEATTRKACANEEKDALVALKTLTALKGIGPATASLLLSVHRIEEVPFFSDELFRWLVWDEPGAPGGWTRGIKYNKKEYEEVLRRVTELRKRLGVRADHCEKVAWVLGKEGGDLGSAKTEIEDSMREKREDAKDPEAEKEGKKPTATAKPVPKGFTKETKAPANEKGTKRKVDEAKGAPEGLRRSSRRRTDA